MAYPNNTPQPKYTVKELTDDLNLLVSGLFKHFDVQKLTAIPLYRTLLVMYGRTQIIRILLDLVLLERFTGGCTNGPTQPPCRFAQ